MAIVKPWSAQLGEVTRTAGRVGETRFYYSGMAQAAVVDRLLPDWKERAFEPDVMLEDLLRVWMFRRLRAGGYEGAIDSQG